METECSALPVSDVFLQTHLDTAKCQSIPRNLVFFEQRNFEALRSAVIRLVGKLASIEDVDLIDRSNVDQGESGGNGNIDSGFFLRFPAGSVLGGLAVLHEARRQGPVADARFNGASAKQNFSVEFANAASNDARIFVLNVAAAITDVSRQRVAFGNLEMGRRAALVAESGHKEWPLNDVGLLEDAPESLLWQGLWRCDLSLHEGVPCG